MHYFSISIDLDSSMEEISVYHLTTWWYLVTKQSEFDINNYSSARTNCIEADFGCPNRKSWMNGPTVKICHA